jgi:hypothetical protein
MSREINRVATNPEVYKPSPILRAVSFVYRFFILLIIVAYREGSRDA